MTIEENIFTVKQLINNYAEKYGRKIDSIHLLAVSKGQSIEKIREALNACQYHFGENYLQEALTKILTLSQEKIVWHFIGPIQRNKTRKIAEHFSWVHSVDDIDIAKRLDNQRPLHLPPLNICIQVNISMESTKSGIKVDELFTFAKTCLTFPRLRLRGLMAIPAPLENLIDQRKIFRQLFLQWQTLRDLGIDLDTLSMGMSDDFEAAIAEGSTLVRIGTAIFGKRER